MKIIILFLFLFSQSSLAIVQFNPINGLWMGNVCMGLNGIWTYLQILQPVGSFCQIYLPNGQIIQGQIVNM